MKTIDAPFLFALGFFMAAGFASAQEPVQTPTPPAASDNTKPVFETPLMTAKTPQPRIIDVEVVIKGAKELYLVVTDEGGISCDWADWIEPRLVMADGKTIDLTTLKSD